MIERTILYPERPTRIIVRRTIIHGTLELVSPTLISNGDSDLPTDMSLLRDAVEGKALVPGSSIAGALRAYLAHFNQSDARIAFGASLSSSLRTYLHGGKHSLSTGEAQLFGAPMSSEDSDGDQSAILISDAISD